MAWRLPARQQRVKRIIGQPLVVLAQAALGAAFLRDGTGKVVIGVQQNDRGLIGGGDDAARRLDDPILKFPGGS
jgi:hypothetical protein